MKKLKRIFIVSVLLWFVCGLSLSAFPQEYFTTEEIRQELNLLQSNREVMARSYKKISIQYQIETLNLSEKMPNSQTNSNQQDQKAMKLAESSETLQSLLNQGDSLFDQLDSQLSELQEQLANSETTIINLQTLLSQASETMKQLSENLVKAQMWAEQMGERLQENNEDLATAYEDLKFLEQQNIAFKLEADKYRKQVGTSGLAGFGFAGVGFGIGTPLLIEGIQSDNQTMLWTGAGTIIGTSGIWLLGHYLFQWW